MTDAQAVVVGAAISGVVGVLVVVVQQRIAHGREDHNSRAARLADFSAAGWVLTLTTGDIARADHRDKAQIESDNSEHTYRFLQALAQVQLLDPQPLYDAALDVDRELTILYSAAKTRRYSKDEWRDARRALTEVVLAFQRVARRELGSAEIQLRQPSSDELQVG